VACRYKKKDHPHLFGKWTWNKLFLIKADIFLFILDGKKK
jgi:hypothetical protein